MKEMPSWSNLLIPLSALLSAFPALASVEISEVAWMGTANSAQDEWIELYSASGSDLSGWILKTEDGGMTVNLSGAIPVGGYFLIERTDDTTVPDVSADLIVPFGSGLNNSGEILILLNSSGGQQDRIDASSGWPAGDNTTKDTMQKVSGAWQTLAATPKAASPGGASVPESSASSDSEAAPAPNAGWVEEEEKKFTAVINSAPSGIAGADFIFEGRLNGESGKEVQAERYFWSFGDGGWANGSKVPHVFVFPGKYQVNFSAKIMGRAITAYQEIEIFENKLAVIDAKGGEHSWIKLSNSASQKLNLAGWILRAGGKDFYFPEETYLLPKAFLTIAEEVSGLKLGPGGEIQLLYPNGSLFQSFQYPKVSSPSAALAARPQVQEIKVPEEKSYTAAEINIQPFAEAGSVSQEALLARFFSKSAVNWSLGALGVGVLVALGFIASRRIS